MKLTKPTERPVSQEQLEYGLAIVAYIYQRNQSAYEDILLLADRLDQAVKEIKRIEQKQTSLNRHLQSWLQKHDKPADKKQPSAKQPSQQMDLFNLTIDRL